LITIVSVLHFAATNSLFKNTWHFFATHYYCIQYWRRKLHAILPGCSFKKSMFPLYYSRYSKNKSARYFLIIIELRLKRLFFNKSSNNRIFMFQKNQNHKFLPAHSLKKLCGTCFIDEIYCKYNTKGRKFICMFFYCTVSS